MLLLDKPLVSEFVKDSIRKGLFNALDTGNVTEEGELDLLNERDALKCLKDDPAHRIHTISENSISWIEHNINDCDLKKKIRLFKDKHAFRELLSDLYPEFAYSKIRANEILDFVPAANSYPFVLKPNIGFFSMGVHKVTDPGSWKETRQKLVRELDHIQAVYPKAVLDTNNFIIEEVIEGDEYAIDAYFNSNGKPVIVGVMHHLFGSKTDVSDRVYLTSSEIVNRHKNLFLEFLAEIGSRAQLKDFSLHLEARINTNGNLIPIEINPLRFGAWCTSADLMHYAFNINPYQLYLNNSAPQWNVITHGMSDDAFGIVILENSTGIPASSIASFNCKAALENFSDILEVREINYREYPIFCIVFVRIRPENFNEIDTILQEDLKKYLVF